MTGSRTLDIGLLKLFCALWDTRSVSRTAVLLDISQSSASAGLARLRNMLDDRLFVWDGSRMIPTPKAVERIDEIRRILAALDALVEPDAPDPSHFRRHFVIASADYLTASCGATLVDRCAAQAPGLVCEFVDVKPDMLNKGAGAGIDFFLMPSSRLQTAGLESAPVYDDRYVCVGRQGNGALAAAASDTAAFLALPHIGYTSVQRAVFSHEANMWATDRQPDYRLLGPHYLAFALIAARSGAVAIVPGRVAAMLRGMIDLQVIDPPIALPPIAMALYWTASAGRDAAHAWLRDALIDSCRA